MESMIIIENTLVSDELIESSFSCDLRQCRGNCCVEGDAGAPLEVAEVDIIRHNLEHIRPYMSPDGLNTLASAGFSTRDAFGGLVTGLNPGKECVFTYFHNGVALCAIEKAYQEGHCDFQKPVSCHLYPVRVSRYDTFEAVNVHHWHVCAHAWANGQQKLYQYLKGPLIRKFGEEWYHQLELAAAHLQEKSGE